MNTIEALQALDKLEETHFQEPNLTTHYDKHVAKDYYTYFTELNDELFDPIDKEVFDKDADELSKQPVYTSDLNSDDDVIGFVTTSGRIVKYRKSTRELVVYVAKRDNSATVSYYRATPESYLRKKHSLYKREIFPEDGFYNN